ncbi:hypothetical protein RPMA_12485 [Tardiphaga alba]|uniref:DUF6950 domain-containing protein n=1 Tax=Tardiphaga alba TaxID=340268 RepID=A0ABX8A747_9BRAD|nr:hypothetical protein [Tardiphaga alba]QUS39563.1 hypothetical protein RPMA_12485 [Tardiphaga alba]
MDADVKVADAVLVARLAEVVAKDRAMFEVNVKAAVAKSGNSRAKLEIALLAAMDAATQSEMVWGKDDCVLWCANILKVAIGCDPVSHIRGRYRTRIGARRLIGRRGLLPAARVVARKRGWRRINEGEQVGDIGVAVLSGVLSVVICRAPGWFVGRNERGWTSMPSTNVRIIWAVI